MDYFPIKIQYCDSNTPIIVKNPEDVECGRGFRVLATRYDLMNEESKIKVSEAK